MLKKILYFLLFFIILFISYYYFFYKNDKITNITYNFTKIEKGDIKKIISATGTVVPTSEIILSSEISGKIANIYKDYNDIVKKGENLAIFDQNPFILKVEELQTAVDISNSILKQKKASLEKAKAELSNAKSNKSGSVAKIGDYELYIANLKTNLEKQAKLFKKKYISEKEFETSELDFNRSFFQLQNLKAELLSLEATIDSKVSTIKIIEAEIEEIKLL